MNPLHFSPHCLRHSYASLMLQQGDLMLQQGESLTYVQRQLGHRRLISPRIPTGSGCHWGTKRPWIGWMLPFIYESGSKVVAESGSPLFKRLGWPAATVFRSSAKP